MASLTPKLFRTVARSFLAIVSFILVAAIAVQMIALAAIGWLSTESGKTWFRDQLVLIADQTGYAITLGTASYTIVDGLTLTDLTVGDQEGVIATANKVSADVSFVALAARQLSVSLSADAVHILRLPARTENPPDRVALKPFILPDLYLTSAQLNKLSIRRLTLDAAIAGQEIVLSPSLSVSAVRRGNTFDVRSAGGIEQTDSGMAWMPDSSTIHAIFSTDTLLLQLQNLEIKSSSYELRAKGEATLTDEGGLALTVNTTSKNLEPLTGQAGSAEAEFNISGVMTSPQINGHGKISLTKLKEKGLGDILASLTSENLKAEPQGKVQLETTYKDKPISIGADYLYEKPSLKLTSIKGDAPDMAVAGSMDFDVTTALMDGNVTLTSENLKDYADLFDVTAKGSAKVQLSLAHKEEIQSAQIELKIQDGGYEQVFVRNLEGTISFPNVSTVWPDYVDMKAGNLTLSDDITFTSLAVSLKDKQAGVYSLTMDGSGIALQPFQIKGAANLSGLQQDVPSARDISLTLKSRGSSLLLAGSASPEALDLSLKTDNLSLSSLPVTIPEMLQSVKVSGDAHLQGTPAAPLADMALAFTPVSMKKGAPDIRISMTGSYKYNHALVNVTGAGSGIRVLKGQADIPAQVSLNPVSFSVPESTAVKGSAEFDLSGASLAATFLPPDHQFSGDIKGQGKLAGTLGVPELTGSAILANGTYLYEPYGVRLSHITLQTLLAGSQVSIENLIAQDGAQGRLEGAGKIDLSNAAQTSLDLKIHDFHLFRSRTVDGLLGADLKLRGGSDVYMLSGSIKTGQVDITIPEQFKSDIPVLNIVKNTKAAEEIDFLKAVALNISVLADNQIFVRGWGLDAEFGGDVAITGNLSAPQLNGNFKAVRGRYEEFGKRLTLARADLRFQGSVPPSPYLDIEATTNAGDVVASILLTGPVSKPKINFASVPALPEDEILSRILFGKNMSKITPFQAIQLARTLQKFSGKGGSMGFDPLGNLRSLTGLDDISVETDDAGDTSVGVGKYLTDKVYLQVKKGKSETSGAASLQVEVTPSITLESEVGQDAQAGGGVFWKWDY